jgi:hypothetical protein
MTPFTALLAGYLGLLGAALAVEGLGRAGREPFRPLRPRGAAGAAAGVGLTRRPVDGVGGLGYGVVPLSRSLTTKHRHGPT